jgi:hypothetical protein
LDVEGAGVVEDEFFEESEFKSDFDVEGVSNSAVELELELVLQQYNTPGFSLTLL